MIARATTLDQVFPRSSDIDTSNPMLWFSAQKL